MQLLEHCWHLVAAGRAKSASIRTKELRNGGNYIPRNIKSPVTRTFNPMRFECLYFGRRKQEIRTEYWMI